MINNSTVVNRYQLKDKLGEGGMGKVFRAYDRLNRQDIALKQVTTPSNQFEVNSKAPTGSNLDKALAHEFRLLSGLRHPNIISVLDYGFDVQQQPFFTMTLLEKAQTIHEACKDASLETQIGLLIQMLQALQYLHRHDMLHRDLKPANVLVVDKQVYLLDFGLALDSSYARIHEAGGTLPYMPPEVVTGKAVSPATDLYSFGMMAYEILLGEHPFDTQSQGTLIGQILMQPVTIPDGVIDDGLALVLMRLLAKDPAERYASAFDTIQALCRATNHPMPEESEAIRNSFIVAAKFIGRRNELKRLSKALTKTLEGKGSGWLIGGESGVGKSRLIDEIRIEGLVNGALVVRGQAISDGGLSYKLWRDILPHLVIHLELKDDEIAILRQLVPNIEQLLGHNLPDDFVLDADVLKNRLALVLVDVVLRVAEQQALILLLEDLQWANESLDILKMLLPLASQSKLMLLANYRNDETPHLPETFADMKHIELRRMSEDDIRKLSVSMLGAAGESKQVVNLLQRETEGNIFFIVEVVRALAEEAGQLDHIGRATIPAQVFAGGVQQVIERRLSRLPEWTRYLVDIAAIAGRQIDRKIITHLAPEIDVDAWFTACSDAAVFVAQGDDWLFAHDKLREHLLAKLLDVEKQKLHEKIGQAIEICYADSLQDYAEVLMKHFAIAKNRTKEGKYAALACEQILTFNSREALSCVMRAIELEGHQHHANPQAELARLHYVAGCANVRLSQFDVAQNHLETSKNLAIEANYQLGMAQSQNVLGELLGMVGKNQESIPLVQASLEIFRELNDLTHIYYALTNLAISNYQLGNIKQAHEHISEGVEVISQANNPLALAQAYNNYANTFTKPEDLDTSLDIHERALAIRRHYKDRSGMASSLINIGSIQGEKGNFDEAEKLMKEGVEMLGSVGNKQRQARALEALGNMCRQFEKFDAALGYYQSALHIVKILNLNFHMASILANLGHLQVSMSDLDAAYQTALDATSKAQELDLLPSKIEAIFLLAKIKWEQNDYLNAVKWFGLVVPHRDIIAQRGYLDEAIETAKTSLDEALFDKAFNAGKDLDVDEVVKQILVKGAE